MIEKAAVKIVDYLVEKNSIEKNNIPFYRYGIEITISFLLNVFWIMLISLVFGNMFEGIVFLFVFISLRHFTGGYHAKSYFSCNLKFSICYVILEFLFHLTYSIIPLSIMITTILFCLAIFSLECPIENSNKPLKNNEKKRFKVLGLALAMLYSGGAIFLYVYYSIYSIFIIYTILLVAILVLVATIQEMKGGLKSCRNDN